MPTRGLDADHSAAIVGLAFGLGTIIMLKLIVSIYENKPRYSPDNNSAEPAT